MTGKRKRKLAMPDTLIIVASVVLLEMCIRDRPKGYQMKSNHVWILKIKLTIVFTLNQTIHLSLIHISIVTTPINIEKYKSPVGDGNVSFTDV